MGEHLSSPMKFWRIVAPSYSSDHASTFLNGALNHAHSMPGVRCDVCGETWGGIRIHAIPAPPIIAQCKSGGWPLPLEQFDALRTDAEREIGDPALRLLPGDTFQPAVLDVPSIPRADFLWGSLGSLVVSARIKQVLEKACGKHVRFSEVTLGKIGKREANLPAPIPSSGEPEDLITEAAPLIDRSSVGPYFEAIPTTESGWPPGGEPMATCAGCLRNSINNEERRLVMTPKMWRGAPIFYLATTVWIIVTDDLKKQLLALRPSNVVFNAVE